MSNFRLDGRTIAIGVLVLIAAVVFLPRLLGGNNEPQPSSQMQPSGPTANPRDTTIVDDGIELGRVVTATNIDRNGCATDVTSTFAPGDIVYVVAENSDVTEGTAVFVRWYLDNELYEESDQIVADQDYQDTCINFTLEPDQLDQLRSGSYEAEFIINGNPANTVAFQVR